MDSRSTFAWLVDLPVSGLACVLLAALAFAVPALCDPIHDAAKIGDLATVQALLKDNPNLVFSKDQRGWTPLDFAASYGHMNVAELLLPLGADVNARSNDGFTPLELAAQPGYIDVAQLLLAHGADVNARNNNNVTPLYMAEHMASIFDVMDSENDNKNLIEFLRQHGGQE